MKSEPLRNSHEWVSRYYLESLREDADRYRWLKSRTKLELFSCPSKWNRVDGSEFTTSHTLAADDTRHAPAKSLDETIDAAMRLTIGQQK
jgi:hypothetical protein